MEWAGAATFSGNLSADGNTLLLGYTTIRNINGGTLSSGMNLANSTSGDARLLFSNTVNGATIGYSSTTNQRILFTDGGGNEIFSVRTGTGQGGNTTIGGTLGVTGAATFSGTLGVSGLLYSADVTGLKYQLNGNVTANYYGIEKQAAVAGGDGSFKFESGKTNAGEFIFSTGGTQRLLIAAGGAATFSSSVTATQFITGGTPSNTAGFTNSFYAESNVPSLTLSNTGTNTGKFSLGVTNGAFGVWNNATSNYPLFINSSNNVLIGGTTDAGYKLLVNGTSYTAGLAVNATAYQGDVTMNTGTTYVYNAGSGSHTFTLQSASGSNQVFIVKNASSRSLTIATTGGDVIIDNAGASTSTFTLAANKVMIIQQDGGSTNIIISIY
jgi:hypothetical protein